MRAIFIRHGQSTGNAGIPCHDLALLELTELGWRQSREAAASWTETPDLIVTSPYLRTQQTAAATIERFPNVPVEVWPIQEFTYLQPSRWNGTLSSERMPHIERYWAAADPEFYGRAITGAGFRTERPGEDAEVSGGREVRPLPTPDRLRWSAGKGTGRRRMRETNFRSQGELRRLNQLHAVQERRCFYCRKWISFLKLSTDPHCATVDHFIPLALGGRDNLSNVVLACGRCNRRKADRAPTIPEFLQWNELAKVWPHIQPVSLALHARRLCVLCSDPIASERLLQSIESGSETETCSRLCRLAVKKNRRLSRELPDLNHHDSSTTVGT